MATAAEVLRGRIARHGPVPFDQFMEVALYEPGAGFYERGGQAGTRTGDFLTSVEVGPLFGAVVAGYLDEEWHRLGRPDPFVVIEGGAGVGRLAASVRVAQPVCSPALRYVLVERSATQRFQHAKAVPLEPAAHVLGAVDAADDESPEPELSQGPLWCSLGELPTGEFDGVVIANELLDNLPFDIVERTDEGWSAVLVGDSGEEFVEVAVPTGSFVTEVDVPFGSRLPVQAAAAEWVRSAIGCLRSGSVVAIDYAASTTELAARGMSGWLRTYRNGQRGSLPLHNVGGQDITADVDLQALSSAVPGLQVTSQADWLRSNGIERLVQEGAWLWDVSVASPTVAAVRGRSRASESTTLMNRDGLGGFAVCRWSC